MRRISLIILAVTCIIAATTAQAQTVTASKKYITKTVKADNFHSIVVNGSPTVIYQQKAGAPSIEIYGSDNIVPLIETSVKNGVLTVRFKKNTNIRNIQKLEVRVTSPRLIEATVKGSGDIEMPKGVKVDGKFTLLVNGSGDINGQNIICEELVAKVSGSGDIELKETVATTIKALVAGSGDIDLTGKCETASYEVAGSGDIRATRLKATHVTASVKGSGDIECTAIETLTGSSKGSGEVEYKGNPEVNFSGKGLSRM